MLGRCERPSKVGEISSRCIQGWHQRVLSHHQVAHTATMETTQGLEAVAAPTAQQGLETGPISLSAQAELELELSLRGSLLVQQQRRIVQLEDELQRAWAEIERLRTKLGSLERDRQPADEDGSRQPRY